MNCMRIMISSNGVVPVTVAEKNDHIGATTFDLPPLPVPTEFIANSDSGLGVL